MASLKTGLGRKASCSWILALGLSANVAGAQESLPPPPPPPVAPALTPAPADTPVLASPPPATAPSAPAAAPAPAEPTPEEGQSDQTGTAGGASEGAPPKAEPKKEKSYWDRFRIRGYTQFRYNRTLANNPALVNRQGDRYWGFDRGFGIRRARLILQGDAHDRVFVYLQPDFASVIGDQLHLLILRDWYADIAVDANKEFRFRVGQSKVPFGFENMQSSSNRLPFDRSDALNSAVKDERDLGVFFYWAPRHIRERFKLLVDEGLKGSGDYGVFGLGIYNGQTANNPERNDNFHTVARVTYPFLFGKQFVEIGAGGYVGQYVIKRDATVAGRNEYRDRRVHASFILYPQPFGIQAEYNVGNGPEYREGAVVDRFLHGGYVLLSYNVADTRLGTFFPYVRAVHYNGGKKFEENAPPYRIRELNAGLEWQVIKALELTGELVVTRRTAPTLPYPVEQGRLFRLQAQVNY